MELQPNLSAADVSAAIQSLSSGCWYSCLKAAIAIADADADADVDAALMVAAVVGEASSFGAAMA